jgi:hypothetical protein
MPYSLKLAAAYQTRFGIQLTVETLSSRSEA